MPAQQIHAPVCLQNGSTALHAAVMAGNVQTVRLLLGAGADPTLPDQVRVTRHAGGRVQLLGSVKGFPPGYLAEEQTTCRPDEEPSHSDAFKSED